MENKLVIEVINRGCYRLLCALDRDSYSLTYGCFDRRYWGWKIVDFPEATYQRNALILAKMLSISVDTQRRRLLTTAIKSALLYTAKIQHTDGSFDQAFPHEHSFGATAFLLDSLLESYLAIKTDFSQDEATIIEKNFQKAARFLCNHDETHGMIANHIAGAALALLRYGRYCKDESFCKAGQKFLSKVLDSQSDEGWYVEYEGADPGYQTLCVHYLAQYYRQEPNDKLKMSLEKSFEFLKWFVHPNGTFGGEYGSRRTSVFYPGGVALLAREFPVAAAIWNAMRDSLEKGLTVVPDRIDIGNLAPLLSSWFLALGNWTDELVDIPELPCQMELVSADFPNCGIYIRSWGDRYVICGVSNGGVIKIFDRKSGKTILNDCGYVGCLKNGIKITTQLTGLKTKSIVTADCIELETPFFIMPAVVPSPFKFIILRLLSLTIMRSIRLGNLVKLLLVKMMISGKKKIPLSLTRKLNCTFDGRIVIEDIIRSKRKITLKWLRYGVPFCGIHMASAKYFEHFDTPEEKVVEVDVEQLNTNNEIHVKVEI